MKSVWSVVGTVQLKEKITLGLVLETVCNTLNVDINKVKVKNGKPEFVDARKIYGYFANKYVPKAPLVAIGNAISKDHSTVPYYKKKVQDMLDIKDPFYCLNVDLIDEKLMAIRWSNRYYNDNPQLVGKAS